MVFGELPTRLKVAVIRCNSSTVNVSHKGGGVGGQVLVRWCTYQARLSHNCHVPLPTPQPCFISHLHCLCCHLPLDFPLLVHQPHTPHKHTQRQKPIPVAFPSPHPPLPSKKGARSSHRVGSIPPHSASGLSVAFLGDGQEGQIPKTGSDCIWHLEGLRTRGVVHNRRRPKTITTSFRN